MDNVGAIVSQDVLLPGHDVHMNGGTTMLKLLGPPHAVHHNAMNSSDPTAAAANNARANAKPAVHRHNE